MPITKSKEDTWKSSELREQLKTVRFKETSMSKSVTEKSKESRHRSRDDEDRKKSKRRGDVDKYELTSDDRRKDGKHREEHRRKENDAENGERDGKKERAKEKDRRDKPDDRLQEKEKDKERHRNRDKDKEGRRDKDREGHRDKDREGQRDKDREGRRDKDKEGHRDKDKEGHRDKDRNKDKERDGERHKDKERYKDKEEDQSKDKERYRDKHRDKPKSKDEHKNYIEKDDDKERNRDRDKEKERHKEKDRNRERDRRRDEHRKDGERKSSRHRSNKPDGDDDDTGNKERRYKRRDDERGAEKINSTKHNSDLGNMGSKHNDKEGNDNDPNYEDDFEVYEEDFEKNVSSDDDDDDDDSDHCNKNDKDINDKHQDDDDRDEVVPIGQKKGQAEVVGEPGKLGAMSELMKAMAEENEKLLNKSTIFMRSHDRDGDRQQDNLFPNFLINFSKEKRSKVSGRMRARAEEVLKFVELDQKVFDLFALNPASEYEVFIKRFGNSGYMQSYVQTGDDDVDRELQTEEIITKDASTQQPMQFTLRKDNPDDAETTREDFVDFIDSSTLGKFLLNTVPVMLELLEESRMKEFFTASEHKPSNVSFAESLLNFDIPEILKGRPVTACHFSNNFHNWFLTIHAPPQRTETAEDWALRGVVCMWNILDLCSPFKILACQSDPTCCCFSPFSSSLVFAGTADGTLLLWDLTVSSASTAKNLGGFEKLLRQPSFNNALLTSANHKSSVVSIATLEPSKISSNEDANRKDDLDFQVATLELNSLIYLWVPVDVSDQGLDSDLGLSPGGKIKLVQSSIINLASPRKSFGEPSYQSVQLVVLPSNHSHLFVSTNSGRIIHVMKNTRKVVPAFYKTPLDYITEVTSMDLSQFDPPAILAGYSDGSLRIFKTNSSRPISEWMDSTRGHPIRSVAWVKTRPSCFLVADDNVIYIWDLCFSSDEPFSSWSNKFRLNAIAATRLETLRNADGSSFTSMMAIFGSDGRCEIHKLKEEFSKWSRNEDEKWTAFLEVSGT